MSVRSAVPRSFWPLLVLLAASVVWLQLGGEGEPARGLVFPELRAGVDRLTVRTPRGLTLLERDGPDWRLSGTLRDLTDATAVDALLDQLADAEHSAPLAGDVGRAPAEYGLGGAAAREVVVEGPTGRRTLRIGAQNPALGHYHAQGDDGRLVLVTEGLVGLLDGLPDAVRARVLWPGFTREAADTFVVRYPDLETSAYFARDGGGRWWWRYDAAGAAALDPVMLAYQAASADRRREDAAGVWWRARDRVLGNLAAALADLGIQSFPNLTGGREQAPGPEIRLGDASGAHHVLCGQLVGEAELLVWRDDADRPLVVLDRILRDWPPDLAAALHADVLTRGLADADSFALHRDDLGTARVCRDDPEGWLVTTAAPTDQRAGLVAGDLVYLLEHLEIRAVLPPPVGAEPVWVGAPAYRLDVWRTGPGVPALESVVFGIEARSGRPAAWVASTGMLLEIEREGVIAGRTFITRFGLLP